MKSSLNISMKHQLKISHRMKLSLDILMMDRNQLNDFLHKESTCLGHESYGKSTNTNNLEVNSDFNLDETLEDYLTKQLNEMCLNNSNKSLCLYLINNLDSRGYLTDDFFTMHNKKELEKAIYILQSLEPRGVGSKNLKECLLNQLDKDDKIAKIIIENYLEILAYGRVSELTKYINCTQKEVEMAVDKIKSLNPIPARGFSSNRQSRFIKPDVDIEYINGKVEVKIIEDLVPEAIIKQANLNLGGEEVNNNIIKRARLIIDCIEKRNDTFKKVVNIIVIEQKCYFRGGSMKPLTYRNIAQKIGCHQSTIARAIKSRYVRVNSSLLPLTAFFPSNLDKNSVTTQEELKESILRFIATEDKLKPYKDEELVAALEKDGIYISRRTLSKYRKLLNIPTFGKRKLIKK